MEHGAPDDDTTDADSRDVQVNPFVQTADDNHSTFALDVDTASYTVARRKLNDNEMPAEEGVRVEEFINYFVYDYAPPQEETFGISIDAAPSPFGEAGDPSKHFVRIGLQGKVIPMQERDDAILTFVIDASGSMDEPDRLPLVRESLRMLVKELRDTDEIALVVYSEDARIVLDHTPVAERDRILDAIELLIPQESTNVEDGLRLGYEVASHKPTQGVINRVMLCSDGIANVGATSPEAILESVRGYAEDGIYLTTIGFGIDDYNDLLMEQLANDGNSNYGYIDTLDAAKRFLLEDIMGTLQVIARNARVQVEFNPETVERYRLLGYENRAIADEEFRNDKVDAGEVGAGHDVTALYKVVFNPENNDTALIVQVRYEDPETDEVIEVQQPFTSSDITPEFAQTSPQFRLAVAVGTFAELLRGSHYADQYRSLDDVLTIAQPLPQQMPYDPDVQKFVTFVEKARMIRGPQPTSTPEGR